MACHLLLVHMSLLSQRRASPVSHGKQHEPALEANLLVASAQCRAARQHGGQSPAGAVYNCAGNVLPVAQHSCVQWSGQAWLAIICLFCAPVRGNQLHSSSCVERAGLAGRHLHKWQSSSVAGTHGVPPSQAALRTLRCNSQGKPPRAGRPGLAESGTE